MTKAFSLSAVRHEMTYLIDVCTLIRVVFLVVCCRVHCAKVVGVISNEGILALPTAEEVEANAAISFWSLHSP